MSGLLPTVVMPDDVRATKARLDPFALVLDRCVALCPQLPPYDHRSWADFYRGWRHFADADASWFHAAAEYDQADRYEEHLVTWQAYLAAKCPIAGPPFTRPKDTSMGSLSDVKTIAIAGAVVVVALTLRGVLR